MSRDPGLIALEQGSHTKAPPDFIQRDQNVKGAAADRLAGMRDPDADLGAVFRRANEARDQRLAPADNAIRHEEDDAASLDRIRQEEGANFGVIANSEAKANARAVSIG